MAGTATSVASLGTNWVDQVYADAFTVFRAQNHMSNLVTTFNDRTGDEARASSTYNQITAGTVAETSDLTSELELNKTNVATLSVKELGYVSFLTDRRIETDEQNAQSDLSIELGAAAADKVESDLLGTFGSFTGGTIGTGGTGDPMTWNKLFSAATVLRSSKVQGPFVAVIHENAWHKLATAVSPSASATNAPESLREAVKSSWYQGTYGGISIFTTANIAAGTAAVQGVFVPQAVAIDWRRGIRLETQRDATRRGTEFVISAKYAAGAWRPTAGVKLISDASLPTG